MSCIEVAREIAKRDRYNENEGTPLEQAYRRGWNSGAGHIVRELDLRLKAALVGGER